MRLAAFLSLAVPACLPLGDSLTRTLDKTGVIDLTYPLDERSPSPPRSTGGSFTLESFSTIEKDGFLLQRYCAPADYGTHLTAPRLLDRGQPSVAALPVRGLYGPAFVLDLRERASKDPDALLTRADVLAFERRIGRRIPRRALVFLRTGWGSRARNLASYRNQDARGRLHHPGFSAEAAGFLVHERGVSALGIDTLSVDRGLSSTRKVQRILSASGRYAIVNVANLDLLPEVGALVLVAPLKISRASAGQARVMAFVSR
jgi:kynurenine formamidase